VEVERAAETLYHVVLDISDNPELMAGHTTPGQFVQVRVGDSKPAFLAIASPPATSSGGSLEFLIKYVEGSTAGFLCNLRKGDTVELSQVLGNGFDIRQISPPEKYSTVFLFATGSGISPIRSLLESGLEASKRSDVTLYYGARNLQRMAYQERFKEWESSGVKIVPVLSQPDDDWTGERGYVQEAFARAKQIRNPLASGAALCGHKGMAEDVTSLLASVGVSKEKILKNF
jgi:NAD(P)H-flavin reductase